MSEPTEPSSPQPAPPQTGDHPSKPNKGLWCAGLEDFVLVTLGGAAGGFLTYISQVEPLASRQDGLVVSNEPALFVFSIVAAWLGAYLILGREVSSVARRFALAIVFGFSGPAVVEQARGIVGVNSQQQRDSGKEVTAKSIQIDAKGYTSLLNSGNSGYDSQKTQSDVVVMISDLGCKLTALIYNVAYYPDLEKDQLVFPALVDGLDAILLLVKFDGTPQTIAHAQATLEDMSQMSSDSGIELSKIARGIIKKYAERLNRLKVANSTSLAKTKQNISENRTVTGWVRLARTRDNGMTYEDFLFNRSGKNFSTDDTNQLKKQLQDEKTKVKLEALPTVYLRSSTPAVIGNTVKLGNPIGLIQTGAPVLALDTAEITYPLDPNSPPGTLPTKQIWLYIEADSDSWRELDAPSQEMQLPQGTPTQGG